jgi:transcriptional regulator with XRE-family HTH domain
LKTLGERIKFVQKKSGKSLPDFSKSLEVSRESLINYQQNRTRPDSKFLSTLCELYLVSPTWLLLGEGEPFLGDEGKAGEKGSQFSDKDLVLQLLKKEEERAGITLTPGQRTAVLKILCELVYRDFRSIQELLSSFSDRGKQGDES